MLNYVGVRWGSLVQNITTVAKYFGLLFIIVVALVDRTAEDRRTFHADDAAGQLLDRAVRARARVGAVGVRRLGRSRVRLRRSEGPAAQPAARADLGHARGDRDLPAGEHRVPRRDVGRRDAALEARRGGRRAEADRPGRRDVRRDHGDAVDARHAERIDPHESARVLRDGRRRAAVPARSRRCIRGIRRRTWRSR